VTFTYTLYRLLTFSTENWHNCYSRLANVHAIFCFPGFFRFRVRNPYRTDRQTDRRTDGQDSQCGLSGLPHNVKTFINVTRGLSSFVVFIQKDDRTVECFHLANVILKNPRRPPPPGDRVENLEDAGYRRQRNGQNVAIATAVMCTAG